MLSLYAQMVQRLFQPSGKRRDFDYFPHSTGTFNVITKMHFTPINDQPVELLLNNSQITLLTDVNQLKCLNKV
jgi:hypothetical protein